VGNEKKYVKFTPFQYSEFLKAMKDVVKQIDDDHTKIKVQLKIEKKDKTAYTFWVELNE
jgi:hypothetical protein